MALPRSLKSSDPLLDTVRHLPSDHIARVTLHLISSAAETALMVCPNDRSVALQALVHMHNQKRRVSGIANDAACAIMFNALFLDGEGYLDSVLMAKIERGFVLDAIVDAMREPVVPGTVEAVAQRHLQVVMNVFDRYSRLIIERFEPLVEKGASSFVWGRRQHGIKIDTEDARQNYRLAALRSTSRFDSDNGTITNYVQLWMKNAPHSRFAVPIGESFSLSRTERRNIYEGHSQVNNHALPIENAEHVATDNDPLIAAEDHVALMLGENRLGMLLEILRRTDQLQAVKAAVAALGQHIVIERRPSEMGNVLPPRKETARDLGAVEQDNRLREAHNG